MNWFVYACAMKKEHFCYLSWNNLQRIACFCGNNDNIWIWRRRGVFYDVTTAECFAGTVVWINTHTHASRANSKGRMQLQRPWGARAAGREKQTLRLHICNNRPPSHNTICCPRGFRGVIIWAILLWDPIVLSWRRFLISRRPSVPMVGSMARVTRLALR